MTVPSGARTEFTHLHVASAYSLRYGTATPRALARRAAELGMGALALTDRDGLYGAFKHATACADEGIKPLLGADLLLSSTPRVALDDAGRRAYQAHGFSGEEPCGPSRVTLLAVGRRGWASLCRLVSAAHSVRLAGDGVPAVTRELIAEHAAGLVVLLGPDSDVGRAVAARRRDLARQALCRWRYLDIEVTAEIVDHLGPKSTFRAARLAELARDARTPAVLSNAVRYLDPVDSLVAQVLDAARHLVPLGSPRLPPQGGFAYLAGPGDMAAVAGRVAAAMTGPGGRPGEAGSAARLLAATAELAARCALDPVRDLGIGTRHLPGTSGAATDGHAELRVRCEHAIRHGRYRTADAASRPRGIGSMMAARMARDRLSRELDIIAQTGMASYFLTVADVADRIRNAGIRCAIRGSGAGSFVNHLLGISAIDPLEHDLLMERFLSPVRGTLPDIDLDVESARRLDAYRIIVDAYGRERTACVAMMETYRARSAIRDVAAAMSLPPDEIGAIARAFPHIRARHITAARAELPELRRSRLNGRLLETVFRIAERLDGLPRHVAMHPCGILLSDETLLDRTAVRPSGEGFPLSQLDKDDAELAGVIKLDVLGVRMQSAMAHAVAEIGRVTGERVDIDAIRRDDEDTYAMIRRSDTLGCFQVESPGQRELVKKLAPRDIGDLIVDISLFRPGPVNSDMITPFLRARHGLAEPSYPHEELAGTLRETGGVVVFHEQVLRIIDAMTGCGLAEADLVRRHLSAEGGVERTAPWFRAQALARGFDRATTEKVWAVVAAFGGFGFCKAHAAAFADSVYQSAWLKRHHPAAFYAGVLTHDPGMYPKRVLIADARRLGVLVLPVDVNASSCDWIVEDASPGTNPARSRLAGSSPRGRAPAVRCSLREVKGISDAEVDRIVAGQPYASLRDFWDRARPSRPVAERLALAGAFDSLYAPVSQSAPDIPEISVMRPSRRDLLARVGLLARRHLPARAATSFDLFADAEADDGMAALVPAGGLRDLDPAERVAAELEILGFEVSEHVLRRYDDLLGELNVVRSPGLDAREDGEAILVAGVKVAPQTPAVRSGQRIIFASLDDEDGLVDLAFFESVQDRCAARVFGSLLLLVRGRVRRAGAGPMAVTVNAAECWDIPALEEIRLARGMPAVRAAMAAGDVGPGACTAPGAPAGHLAPAGARPVVFANGFTLSPYAEAGGPGGSLKNAPRAFWRASPGSTNAPG